MDTEGCRTCQLLGWLFPCTQAQNHILEHWLAHIRNSGDAAPREAATILAHCRQYDEQQMFAVQSGATIYGGSGAAHTGAAAGAAGAAAGACAGATDPAAAATTAQQQQQLLVAALLAGASAPGAVDRGPRAASPVQGEASLAPEPAAAGVPGGGSTLVGHGRSGGGAAEGTPPADVPSGSFNPALIAALVTGGGAGAGSGLSTGLAAAAAQGLLRSGSLPVGWGLPWVLGTGQARVGLGPGSGELGPAQQQLFAGAGLCNGGEVLGGQREEAAATAGQTDTVSEEGRALGRTAWAPTWGGVLLALL